MQLKFIFGVIIGIVIGVVLTTTVVVNAVNLSGPATSPDETESYTLADIYHSLNSGQAAEKSTFSEPVDGPGNATMFNLDEIYDLTRQRALVPKTVNGESERGVAWPNPRFTDNGDGTVTDNLTGLIWMKNTDCIALNNFELAVSFAAQLEHGDCYLLDNSVPGDWRVPTVRELHSLVSFTYRDPALSNTGGDGKWQDGDPFTGIESYYTYWTSTNDVGGYWFVNSSDGALGYSNLQTNRVVWPVKGGQ